jgi:galactokinase
MLDAWPRPDGARRVTDAFRERFGGEPDGAWSAPGRVNVIGEHTDYNAGLCMPIALPHRTYVALRARPDDVVAVASAQESGSGVWTANLADVAPGAVSGWGTYVAGVAWALREAGHAVGGFDAVVDSCVPYGSGLSSSAALECAAAVAVDEVHGLGLGADDEGRGALVRLCMRAENEIAGAPTGGLDQSAALLCRPGEALVLDFRDGSVRPIAFDLSAHGLALLVIDTRAEHQHAGGEYAARRASCERAADLLGIPSLREVTDLDAALDRLAQRGGEDAGVLRRRVRHVVTENARVERTERLLAEGRVEAVGAVLTAGHASLRNDYQVSCRELDLAVDAAIAAGGLGGRMVGGGFGGSVIVLVRSAEIQAIADAVAAGFADAGLRAPAFLVATAEGPAGRD